MGIWADKQREFVLGLFERGVVELASQTLELNGLRIGRKALIRQACLKHRGVGKRSVHTQRVNNQFKRQILVTQNGFVCFSALIDQATGMICWVDGDGVNQAVDKKTNHVQRLGAVASRHGASDHDLLLVAQA